MNNAERLNKTAITPYILEPKLTQHWRKDWKSLHHKFGQFNAKRDLSELGLNPTAKKDSVEFARIVILILSAPRNFENRLRMRSFTINDEIPELLFVLGKVEDDDLQKSLEEESRIFGDILQISFPDSYHNLPYKTIAGFDFITSFRTNVSFIMKMDDDLHVNSGALR